MSKELENVISIQKKKLVDMTDEEITIAKYRSLEARYNSVMEAVDVMSNQNEIFRKEIEVCYKKMENAQTNVDISKKTVMDLVLGQNNMKNDFINEINILKDKLKKAKEAIG